MRNTLLVVISAMIIIGGSLPQVVAQNSATCFPNGTYVITSDQTLSGVTCEHVGTLVIQTGAALTLRQSSLVIDANGSSASLSIAPGSTLALVGSSLTFTNGTGTLVDGGGSRALFVGSSLHGGAVEVDSQATFVANSSSVLAPTSLTTLGSSSFLLESATLAVEAAAFLPQPVNVTGNGVVRVEGRTFEALSSLIALDNLQNSSISALNTIIVGSKVESFGLHQLAIGNATVIGGSTTFLSSSISVDSFLPASTIVQAYGSLVMSDSLVQSAEAGGVNVKSNLISMKDSRIVAPFALLTLTGYQLNATDSSFASANSRPLITFGITLTHGNLLNDTFSSCTLPPKSACFGASGGGSYSISGYLSVHVADSSGAPLSGATVQAFDTSTGLVDYVGLTDNVGNATIPVLLTQATAGPKGLGTQNVLNRASYIVQASSSGKFSPQELVGANNTMNVVLTIPGTAGAITPQDMASGASALAQKHGLAANVFPITPSAFFVLGPYIGTEFIPTVTVVSNAYPLNFFVNAGQTQLTFSTVGQSGLNDTFVVYYPKNLTVSPMGVYVDGVAVQPVEGSNSTFFYSYFSFPSGLHSVVLTFIPPNGAYSGAITYPYIYPSGATIGAVTLIAAIGLLFVYLLVRRRESGAGGGGGVSRRPPGPGQSN